MAYIMCKAPLGGTGAYPAIQSWSSSTLPKNSQGENTHAFFPAEFMNTFYMAGKKCAGFVIPTYNDAGDTVTALEWDEEKYQAWLASQPKWYVKGISQKIDELSKESNEAIISGVDVVFQEAQEAIETGEAVPEIREHFDLTVADQQNLSNLFQSCVLGATEYPYHCKDGSCKVYSAEQIAKIFVATQLYITHHNTKFNQMKQYVKSFDGQDDKESECMNIRYSDELTGEYLENYNSMMNTANQQIQSIMAKMTTTLGA